MNEYLGLVYYMFNNFNHNDTINVSQFEYLLMEKSETDHLLALNYHNMLRTFHTACTEKDKFNIWLGLPMMGMSVEEFMKEEFKG